MSRAAKPPRPLSLWITTSCKQEHKTEYRQRTMQHHTAAASTTAVYVAHRRCDLVQSWTRHACWEVRAILLQQQDSFFPASLLTAKTFMKAYANPLHALHACRKRRTCSPATSGVLPHTPTVVQPLLSCVCSHCIIGRHSRDAENMMVDTQFQAHGGYMLPGHTLD
jgi:hypothetical protein